jgi:hypothetical protein
MQERRKFERLHIPASAAAYVSSPNGQKLGRLSILGRGGFQVDTDQQFKIGDSHKFNIVDESQGINRQVTAVARNTPPGAVGFEFQELDVDTALEVGVLIGKYHS